MSDNLNFEWGLLAPEFILAGFAGVIILIDLFWNRANKEVLGYVAALGPQDLAVLNEGNPGATGNAPAPTLNTLPLNPPALLTGYYRFAVLRNDRFEIGPTVGVGYLSLNARIEATGTVSGPGGTESRSLDERASTGSMTGAVGGYAVLRVDPAVIA